MIDGTNNGAVLGGNSSGSVSSSSGSSSYEKEAEEYGKGSDDGNKLCHQIRGDGGVLLAELLREIKGEDCEELGFSDSDEDGHYNKGVDN